MISKKTVSTSINKEKYQQGMASQQQYLAPKQPQKPTTLTPDMIYSIKEKLKELGPEPYTPEKQKEKDNLLKYLNFDTQQQQQQQIVQISQQPVQMVRELYFIFCNVF